MPLKLLNGDFLGFLKILSNASQASMLGGKRRTEELSFRVFFYQTSL